MGRTMAVSMAAVMSVLVMSLALVMSSLIRVVEVLRNDPDRLTRLCLRIFCDCMILPRR